MKSVNFNKFFLAALIVILLGLFFYVALRSGPLAPTEVTVTTVKNRILKPSISGVGTVSAQYTYKIGPTSPGRLLYLTVDIGDSVKEGELLGEMDPVDLDERILAQQSGLKAAEANIAQLQAKQSYANEQAKRYEQLLPKHLVSVEVVDAKRQDKEIANAALIVAKKEVDRLYAERNALLLQRKNLKLISPASGIVISRNSEPGSTVIAGQSVLDIIKPDNIWIDARFDQISSAGITNKLPAHIILRSRGLAPIDGYVSRIEPLADTITEEMRAKISFAIEPDFFVPIGELAEIEVRLPPLPSSPVIPNAGLRFLNGIQGVWKINNQTPVFVPVTIGQSDLDGNLQIKEGLMEGDTIIVYSEKMIHADSRIKIVNSLQGLKP